MVNMQGQAHVSALIAANRYAPIGGHAGPPLRWHQILGESISLKAWILVRSAATELVW